MGDQVILVADLGWVDPRPIGYAVRPVARSDRDALGRLYFESYDPGLACDTLEEAVDDIQASFDGEYGRLLGDASWMAVDGETPVGAVLTVHRPPWEGFPDCPLIIELFVARPVRRQGIGSGIVEKAMRSLSVMGEDGVSLRVDVDNRPARDLYESLGFTEWFGPSV